MLKRLEIENFRSIRSATFMPSETGVTVLIGANGTGKSNLIRCLEFLSDLPRHGLEQAFRVFGGVDSILPKAIPLARIKGSVIRLQYSVDLPIAPDQPPERAVGMTHDLRLAVKSSRVALVQSEQLLFTEPLLMLQRMRARPSEQGPVPPSRLEIVREGATSAVSVVADPPLTSEYRGAFLDWLGLPFLREAFEKQAPENIQGMLGTLLAGTADPENPGVIATRPPLSSLLDTTVPSFFYSAPLRRFSSWMMGIRRFDLQLANLRKQQDIVAEPTLAPDGRGLPAAVREAKTGKIKAVNWRRIASTLAELAPHVVDTSVSQVKTGQEFVQFLESKTGRPVESWHASDGTLRALAILLAVETHTGEGMLLIEEPEQGLHPWAVRTLIAHIRESVSSRGLQVVLSTHSEHVLDNVAPHEVVVATRHGDGGTELASVEQIAPSHTIEPGELGRMWVSGLLGGVPRMR